MAEELNFVKEAFVFSNNSSQVIQSSFGPNGLDCMISKSSGTLLVTNNGFDVMKSLSCQSSHGRMIFRGLEAFYKCAGDFSNKYILLMQGLLCEILSVIEGDRTPARQQLLSISHGMWFILVNILPKLIDELGNIGPVNEGTPEFIKTNVIAIIKTNLNGKFSPKTCNDLTNLLKNLLFESNGTMTVDTTVLKSRVEYLVDNFSDIFFEVPGLPVSSSTVLSGIVIPRKFCTMLQKLPNEPTEELFKFILLRTSLGYDLPHCETVLELKDPQKIKLALAWHAKHIENIIQTFFSLGIKLVVSSEALPETIVHFCNQYDMAAIQLVPKEDMIRLCNICKINPVFEVETIDDFSPFIGKALSCKPIQIGQHTYVYLEPAEIPQHVSAKQVILYALCEPACRQYSTALQNALKCVKYAFMKHDKSPINALESTFRQNRAPKLSVVSGGGVFETGLAFALERHRRENKVELNVKTACCILEKAMLSIPRQLIENVGKPLSLCHFTAQARAAIVCGKIMPGLNKNGDICDVYEEGVLEPLMGNTELVSSVIQLFIQILRTDQIVHVKELPQNNTFDSDEESNHSQDET